MHTELLRMCMHWISTFEGRSTCHKKAWLTYLLILVF